MDSLLCAMVFIHATGLDEGYLLKVAQDEYLNCEIKYFKPLWKK